jgi:hypothetical protein
MSRSRQQTLDSWLLAVPAVRYVPVCDVGTCTRVDEANDWLDYLNDQYEDNEVDSDDDTVMNEDEVIDITPPSPSRAELLVRGSSPSRARSRWCVAIELDAASL